MAEDINEKVAAAAARPRYEYTVPETAREFASDPKVVVLQPITIAEERAASKASTEPGRFAYESLKHALVSADGVEIPWKDGGKERFVEGCSPRVRSLLLQAFADIHVPADKDQADFLASRKTTV